MVLEAPHLVMEPANGATYLWLLFPKENLWFNYRHPRLDLSTVVALKATQETFSPYIEMSSYTNSQFSSVTVYKEYIAMDAILKSKLSITTCCRAIPCVVHLMRVKLQDKSAKKQLYKSPGQQSFAKRASCPRE